MIRNTANGNSNSRRKLIPLLFCFFFLINIVSGGGHFDWWDGIEAYLVTESMVLRHSAMLYPDIPSIKKLQFDISYSVYSNTVLHKGIDPSHQTMSLEPVYTVRSLLLSAAAIPFYLIAISFSISPIPIIALFFNSIILSLLSVVVFLFSVELYNSRKIAFVLSIILGVGSFIWPYHTSFWSMPLQALCLISSAYFLHKSLRYFVSIIPGYTKLPIATTGSSRKGINSDTYIYRAVDKGICFAALGGLFLGLSVFSHPTSIILIPGFIAYYYFSSMNRKKGITPFLITLTITLLFEGVINELRFGSFTEFGYGYFESITVHNGWHGLVGLIGSPGAGLIFFFPISILLPLAFKYMYKLNRGLFFLCAYVFVVTWLDTGTLSFGFEPYAWSGGIAWGPRYLIPTLPFIVLALGSLLVHLKKIPPKRRLFLEIPIIILCISGVYVNLIGTLVWYQYGIMYGWSKDDLWKNNYSMEIMTWNPYYSPIILHTKALLSNFVSQIQPEKYINTPWYWAAYGLAPCLYDDYIFCKFGVLPICALAIVITILAYIIILELRINPRTEPPVAKYDI